MTQRTIDLNLRLNNNPEEINTREQKLFHKQYHEHIYAHSSHLQEISNMTHVRGILHGTTF